MAKVLIALLLAIASCDSSDTVWRTLGKQNAGLQASNDETQPPRYAAMKTLFNSWQMANIARTLNDPNTDSIVVMVDDTALFDSHGNRVRGQGSPHFVTETTQNSTTVEASSKTAGTTESSYTSSSTTATSSASFTRASFPEYLQYYVANEKLPADVSPRGVRVPTLLRGGADLSPMPWIIRSRTRASATTTSVAQEATMAGDQNYLISDGYWPAASVVGQSQRSNGTILAVDRVLAVPTNLLEALLVNDFENLAYSFLRTSLAQEADSIQGGVTVFAECDRSFYSPRKLRSFLVSGVITNDDSLAEQTVKNWLNEDVHIQLVGEKGMRVNGTLVTRSNILLSNGVLHLVGECRCAFTACIGRSSTGTLSASKSATMEASQASSNNEEQQ